MRKLISISILAIVLLAYAPTAIAQSAKDREIGIVATAIAIDQPTVNDTWVHLKSLYPNESATYLWQIAEWVHARSCVAAPSGSRDDNPNSK